MVRRNSASNLSPAVTDRSAYHRRVSRASTRASGLNSTFIITETAPELVCRDRAGFSGIELCGAAKGFCIPSRASSGVFEFVETGQERGSKVGAIAWPQAECGRQDLLLCAHFGSVRLPLANRQGPPAFLRAGD